VSLAKVLIADDEKNVRLSLVYILFDAGYDVIEAEDGAAAVQKAVLEQPDIILLDVMMPVMNGFEVLNKLRENPATETIPVVLLTGLPPAEGESEGMNFGVSHYITKPWEPETVESTVRVALREAKSTAGGEGHRLEMSAGSAAQRKAPSDSESQQYIKSDDALALLARKLGGGIPLPSLTFIEGSPTSGKSVLCQHLAYGSLMDGHGVAYFSSEFTSTGLIKQMDSIGLAAAGFLKEGRIDIFPVQDPDNQEDSGPILGALAQDIGHVSSQSDLIIVDSITRLVSFSTSRNIMEFFSTMQSLCGKGKCVIIVANSYAFDDNLAGRVGDISGTHLKMSTGKMRSKVLRMVEIVKANDVMLDADNVLSFEVEPGTGIKIIPYSRAKA
jgi:flagellar protein FlaH